MLVKNEKEVGVELELKNVQLRELIVKLNELKMRKRDLIVKPDLLYVKDGRLYVENADKAWRESMYEQGFKMKDGEDYELEVGDFAKGTMCDKLGISRSFKNELEKKGMGGLFWMNVAAMLRYESSKRMDWQGRESWLYDGLGMESYELFGLREKKRNFMLRTYLDLAGGVSGKLRAMLSDSFNLGLDNFTILRNVLLGLEGYEGEVVVSECYLNERVMHVCFDLPMVRRDLGELLKGYVDPDTGKKSGEVISGFILKNSELGVSNFSIQDRVKYLACGNGMLGEKRVKRSHSGEKLEEGVIEWSEETVKKMEEFVMSKTRDVVKGYLSGDVLGKIVEEIEDKGGYELKSLGLDVVKSFCDEALEMSDDDIGDVCDRFMKGGSWSRSIDVMQAVTNHAKHLEGEKRFDLEEKALSMLGDVERADKKLLPF